MDGTNGQNSWEKYLTLDEFKEKLNKFAILKNMDMSTPEDEEMFKKKLLNDIVRKDTVDGKQTLAQFNERIEKLKLIQNAFNITDEELVPFKEMMLLDIH